ncbi:MAG: hypothetical protein WD470_02770, partial [Rhodospirillaceae bacterium]
GAALSADFAPIGDHRASAGYRERVAANLFARLYRDVAAVEPDLDLVAL